MSIKNLAEYMVGPVVITAMVALMTGTYNLPQGTGTAEPAPGTEAGAARTGHTAGTAAATHDSAQDTEQGPGPLATAAQAGAEPQPQASTAETADDGETYCLAFTSRTSRIACISGGALTGRIPPDRAEELLLWIAQRNEQDQREFTQKMTVHLDELRELRETHRRR